jgi:hypothetical protein
MTRNILKELLEDERQGYLAAKVNLASLYDKHTCLTRIRVFPSNRVNSYGFIGEIDHLWMNSNLVIANLGLTKGARKVSSELKCKFRPYSYLTKKGEVNYGVIPLGINSKRPAPIENIRYAISKAIEKEIENLLLN